MTIHAQRDSDIAMTQQLLNNYYVDPHSQQYRCCAMPQIVEMHMRYVSFTKQLRKQPNKIPRIEVFAM